MMMYMYLRYPVQCEANRVGAGPSSFSDFGDMPDIFLIWNAIDPVSDFEMQCNNHAEQEQGNRNPFIDNPFLATQIWNGPEAEDTWDLLNIPSTEWNELVFVYPTITQQCFYINNLDQIRTSSTTKISVYNLIGQKIPVVVSNNQVCLKQVSSGMYLVNLVTQNQNKTFKVVIK